MNTHPPAVLQDWYPVRLTTEHCVLETRLPRRYQERFGTESSPTLPDLVCLPETTLRLRTDPNGPVLLILAHSVIIRSQILQIVEAIPVPVETQFKKTSHARFAGHRSLQPAPPRTRLRIPNTVTPHDFSLPSLSLLTHNLILDATMAVYRGWSTRPPADWIRHDPRALFSLSNVIIRTRDTRSPHPSALLILESCELHRTDILDACSCPAT